MKHIHPEYSRKRRTINVDLTCFKKGSVIVRTGAAEAKEKLGMTVTFSVSHARELMAGIVKHATGLVVV
ncbi:MAG: hypothetical protein HY052_03230 [Proteobacteria bacterium]|nr:hypothetical protein [Pseudomonadota bacterium]